MTLSRQFIEQVIREECAKHCCAFGDVAGRSLKPRAVAARTNAMRRILAETGCGKLELADRWGCCISTVYTASHSTIPDWPYDERTAERLAWAHGAERAARILADYDAPTLADITAWRRLGGGASA